MEPKTMASRQDRTKVHVQCTRLSINVWVLDQFRITSTCQLNMHHVSLRFPILASYITNFRCSWLDMSLEFSVK